MSKLKEPAAMAGVILTLLLAVGSGIYGYGQMSNKSDTHDRRLDRLEEFKDKGMVEISEMHTEVHMILERLRIAPPDRGDK